MIEESDPQGHVAVLAVLALGLKVMKARLLQVADMLELAESSFALSTRRALSYIGLAASD